MGIQGINPERVPVTTPLLCCLSILTHTELLGRERMGPTLIYLEALCASMADAWCCHMCFLYPGSRAVAASPLLPSPFLLSRYLWPLISCLQAEVEGFGWFFWLCTRSHLCSSPLIPTHPLQHPPHPATHHTNTA